VRIEAVVFFLGPNLQGMSKLVQFKTRLFFKTVLRGGNVGIDLSLEGGGVGGGDAVDIERAFDFGLHFATAREEALFEELLRVKVNGVFRDFATNDTADVGTEICVKGGDPRGEGWV